MKITYERQYKDNTCRFTLSFEVKVIYNMLRYNANNIVICASIAYSQVKDFLIIGAYWNCIYPVLKTDDSKK